MLTWLEVIVRNSLEGVAHNHLSTMAKKSGRGKGWCPPAVDILLDIVGEVLPLGKNGWEKVESRFNRLGTPQLLPMRDSEALKRKFLLLKNHAKPTGDPDCPQDVQRAKRIQRDIDMSVSVLSLSRWKALVTKAASGDLLKRGRDTSNQSAGLLSYTAKKRLSIDKYIEGAADAETKATSDMMTILLLTDERAARREESRLERQEKIDREREAREAKRDEMHMLLMSKMLGRHDK
ncbi:Aste57867_23093 [Aphanomyces stellatus]|uniref:Aste57867_23093 protein n=1 Tax=Aphanomyces stellatus TaxID=120398 RepID=A0A485LRG8_9STRA|nr:hypothetical protein As57867_023022 [Aphanomyces stellatus]VFT99741.1 Aste57867_23093 [Aphanomyces stellatus]